MESPAPASIQRTLRSADGRLRWGRTLVLLALGQFGLSVALLLTASTSREPMPLWGGIVDVALVVTLVITSMMLRRAVGDGNSDTLRISYYFATLMPAAIFLSMWYFADRLDFNILLPGLAWRTWLLLYTLPVGVAAWSARWSI